ncbi:ZYBA0S06-01046g1_1 [Zygosaccharomyces bailii CLIB 213]|uniref:Lysophospholipase n=1 Tax=Zygosaccharomyces bailii (strain CLIB 213 / ATCC 58445 / CBS 680 / BCRC 21525 / NBRC 1098 / NCYC 1416 / NRRL Y-2227) TaxID=1333698 RepID=A0A8J2T8I9_ZYGB2|nr:ZYBA0S06-01046g1_1 [Zygosaccharomyces bailii CLIB 213]
MKLLLLLCSVLYATSHGEEFTEPIRESPPKIGLAISGGGYRSMLTASGFIKEMDKYQLFDCLSYMSGLSGGSWVIMDLLIQDFNVTSLLKNWNLDDGLLKGVPDFDIRQKDIVSGMNDQENVLEEKYVQKRATSKANLCNFQKFENSLEIASYFFHGDTNQPSIRKRGIGPWSKIVDFLFRNYNEKGNEKINKNGELLFGSIEALHHVLQFYIDLHLDIRPKKMQGFPVSFTDYLGKAFEKRLDGFERKESSLSDLTKKSKKFQNFEAPIPLFIANSRNGRLRNVIFEFSPFEFGSWEPLLRLFVKTPFLGSTIQAGKPFQCINGYDDIGFITATSSSIFNNVLIYIWQLTAQASKETITAVRNIMSIFGLGDGKFDEENMRPSSLGSLGTDYAVYQPNPFFKYPGVSNELTNNDYLYLVDGGEDGENVPVRPLTIPERSMDIIFIVDSSSDEFNYANGTKLLNVLMKLQEEGKNYTFPKLGKFPRHPVALGCHEPNLPILLYYPNVQHSYSSNTSTFKITYNASEVAGMVQNGRDIFSMGSDPYHMACVGCLIVKRRIEQTNESNIPLFCKQCYSNYCY